MALKLLSFSTLLQNSAAAAQAACSRALNLEAGSALRAILEASASAGLWMQWLILQVLSMTRAATSNAGDLDTWMADFGLVRLPATFATGAVTFARYSATSAALIPLGAQVRTADGLTLFSVTEDDSNATWNVVLGGYLVPAGQASVTVPVAALTAGTAGNVQAATVTLIATALSGIDTVTNATAFVNALGAESDAGLRARFANYINTRSRATPAAVAYAAASVQQGLSVGVQENVTTAGVACQGNFVVTVDDGTGAPPAPLLASVTTAVAAVRPIGSTCQVQGPVVVLANIAMTVAAAPGYTHAQAVAAAGTALAAAVNAGGMGVPFAYGTIFQTALNLPAVASASGVTLNGGIADLTATPATVIRAGLIAIS